MDHIFWKKKDYPPQTEELPKKVEELAPSKMDGLGNDPFPGRKLNR